MPLKIAYVTDERYPSAQTDCQQVAKTIDALGAVGCEVDLIAPRRAVRWFRSAATVADEIREYYNLQGSFRLRLVPTWPASRLRLEKGTHGIAGALAAICGEYDYVHTRNLLPACVATAFGMPVLFETYRALPTSNPTAWRFLRSAMRAPTFLGAAVHSDFSRDALLAGGGDPRRIIVAHNGFDPADFLGPVDKGAARDRLGLPRDARVAVYAGHIRPDKGTSTLVDLAEDSQDWRIVLVGGLPKDSARLAEDAAARGIRNLSIVEHMPARAATDYLAAADVLLLPFARAALEAKGRGTVLPMKVFGYLAAGRPILAPDLADTRGVLVHGTNCLKVAPDDREAAADALALLGADEGLCARLASRAERDALRYTWRRRAESLVEFVRARLGEIRGTEKSAA